jgi:class 3 adenylate cyclase
MSGTAPSAESQLARLLERLLAAAESALAAGDADSARSMAEEVRAVAPDNPRAALILQRLEARQLGPSGERALMTLLFSDLVGSTMLSERVEPEQLRDLFSFYRNAARDAVGRYGGSLVQFSGDGILAGFGHPEPHEDDARRAVLAGLDLVVAMRDAHADLERRLGVTAEVRVGIHTGLVVVTDLRADAVAERDSIVGVTPNLAARVQGVAEPDSVVISDVTRQLVDADFYLRSLGEQALRGITRAVEIFAVERPRYAAARFEAERYHRAGLVGRAGPSATLLEAWLAVRESRAPAGGLSFLLVGEAGIGKSRLVAELLDRVEASEGKVVGVGCLPYYANVSLWPVARMLERILDLDPADRLGDLERHLISLGLEPKRAVPFLGALVGVDGGSAYPAPELDPAAFLDETTNCVLDWLRALSWRTPHLFVVEDLHWADPSTLKLLGRLVTRPPGELASPGPPARILTVATTRDASHVPWVDRVQVLPLERLDTAAGARLVENLAGDDLTAADRASIVEQADGVPLFIEELTRSCLDETRVDPLPLRLQELFTWRFKAPGVDLRVVQVAATVGPAFDAATVAGVLDDERRVADQLGTLTREGIIEPGDPATGGYRFRHALMRDAAYETQVLDVRRHTHATVAQVVGARGGEPALVAEHLDLAGQSDQAIGLYLAAVQAEQARGAHSEATKLLTRVIELVDTLPESRERDLTELTARMLRALSVSSMQGYAAPDVQADHRRAEVLANGLGDAIEVVPSLIATWSYWLAAGDTATSRRVADRLTDMVGSAQFASFEPEVEVCAGFQDFFEGHLDLALAHQERALAGFRARPADALVSPFWPLPNDPVAACLIGIACLLTLRGEPGALSRQEQAIRRAEEVGFPRGPFSVAFTKLYAAWTRRFLGDHEGAGRLGAEIMAIGREHGYAFWLVMGSLYAMADPGSAAHRDALRRTFDTLHLMGQEAFTASGLGYLAELHAAAGELAQAEELVGDGLQVVEKSGEYVHLPELLRQRAAYTLALGGDQREAAEDLQEAVRCASGQGARVARFRAALDLARIPEAARPDDWRAVLAQARDGIPAGGSTDATAAADALLEG